MLNGWSSKRARGRSLGFVETGLAILLVSVAAPAVASADRAYEKVTPADKGAGTVQSVDTFRANADGSRFLMSTSGPFAGIPTDSVSVYTRYLAARSSEGWELTGTDAPVGPTAPVGEANVMNTLVSSDDLSHVLVASTKALAPGAIENGSNLYVRDTRTRQFTLVAASPGDRMVRKFLNNQGNHNAKYVADDGKSALFTLAEVALLPEAPVGGTAENVGYKWTASGGLVVATVLPDGTPVFGDLAVSVDEQGVRFARPGPDGARRVFFNRIDGEASERAVYMREGDSSVLVSQSRVGGVPSGPSVRSELLATSRDTRFALIALIDPPDEDSARLSDDAPPGLPTGPGVRILYRYDSERDQLDYVGHGPSFDASPAFGFSDDGRAVAFSSSSALSPGAVDGQVNVYHWRDGVTKLAYVADPGYFDAAAVSESLRSLSANGRYIVLTDNSPSVAAQFGLENGGSPLGCWSDVTPGYCRQVYRFDSEAASPASELVCVSCRTDGEAPRGHAGDPTNRNPGFIRMDRHQMRMALDDGRVLFTSPDDLVAADGNGLTDVYEYANGVRSLLSRGTAGHGARLLDVTADGASVFFSTSDPISRSDQDLALDIYVLRQDALPDRVIDRGAADCAGSDCRRPMPDTGSAPTWVASVDPGRSAAPLRAAQPRPRVVSARIARGGRVSVRVQAPVAGRISISGAGVRRVTRNVAGGTSYALKTTLTQRQRSQIRRARKPVRINLRVAVSPNFGSPRVIRVARRAGV